MCGWRLRNGPSQENEAIQEETLSGTDGNLSWPSICIESNPKKFKKKITEKKKRKKRVKTRSNNILGKNLRIKVNWVSSVLVPETIDDDAVKTASLSETLQPQKWRLLRFYFEAAH